MALWIYLLHGPVNWIRVPEKIYSEKISVEESKDVEERHPFWMQNEFCLIRVPDSSDVSQQVVGWAFPTKSACSDMKKICVCIVVHFWACLHNACLLFTTLIHISTAPLRGSRLTHSWEKRIAVRSLFSVVPSVRSRAPQRGISRGKATSKW